MTKNTTKPEKKQIQKEIQCVRYFKHDLLKTNIELLINNGWSIISIYFDGVNHVAWVQK